MMTTRTMRGVKGADEAPRGGVPPNDRAQVVRGVPGVWLLVLAVACGGDAAGPPAATARDSAGITIVENHRPTWGQTETWRISAEPVARIGQVDGTAADLLLHPYGAIKLRDGTIVVANSGSEEIRFFDGEGRYLRTAGRKGEGPGEFGNLLWLYPLGEDSIVAWDDDPPTVEIFHRDGTFGRSVRTLSVGVLRGVFADGSLLFSGPPERLEGMAEGRIRRHARAVRLSPVGSILDSLPVFPGKESDVTRSSGGILVMPPAFGRETVFAVAGDGFYAGSEDEAEVGFYDVHGVLRTIVRWPSRERAVTPELIEAYRRHELEQVRSKELRRLALNYLDRQVYPELLPAYGAMEVDGAGRLWVQEYRLPWEDTQSWVVFGRDHGMLGRVVVPGRFVVHQIGEDFVLGYTWDDVDVEYVEMYRLMRPQEEDPAKLD